MTETQVESKSSKVNATLQIFADGNHRPLEWNADGQLLVVTRTSLYIATPTLGVASTLVPNNKNENQTHSFDFITTLIPCRSDINWFDAYNDWRLGLLVGSEPVWKSAAWSPRTIQGTPSNCLLAALNNNYEVTVFSPGTNIIRSVWEPAYHLTRDYIIPKHSKENLYTRDKLLHQTTALTWTKDGILLLGTREGTLSYWSVLPTSTDKEPTLLHQVLYTLSSDVQPHVVQITCSQSNVIACSYSNGAIAIYSKKLDSTFPTELVWSHLPDNKLTTLLKWLPPLVATRSNRDSSLEHQKNLVFAKAGNIHLGDVKTNSAQLSPFNIWNGETAYAPCVGLFEHPNDSKSFVAVLEDSTFYVIKRSSFEVNVDASYQLSVNVRDMLSMSSNSDTALGKNVGFSMYGFVHSDRTLGFACLYFKKQLESLNYQPSASRSCFLSVLNPFHFDSQAIDNLKISMRNIFDKPIPSFYEVSPFVIVRPVLFLIQLHAKQDATFLTTLLDLTSNAQLPASNLGSQIYVQLAKKSTNEQMNNLLQPYIYDSHHLQALRYKYLIIQFTKNLIENGNTSITEAAKQHLSTVYKSIIWSQYRATFDALQKVFEMISRYETPPPCTLSNNKTRIKQVVESSFSGDGDIPELDPSFTDTKCPACASDIMFNNIKVATCENKHIWERCSVTFNLVTGMNTKTCSHCSRKSVITPDDDTDDGIVQAYIDSCNHCMYCGSRWSLLR